MPIATPMSERLIAGASFTPSPVMATMFPSRLRTSTRRTLSSGATRAMTPISSICLSTSASLIAANSFPVTAPFDTQLSRDRRRRRRVVSGDHAHPDSGALAQRDRVSRFLSGWVDDPDEGDQRQVLYLTEEVTGRVERVRVEIPVGHGKDTQAFACQPVVLLQRGLPVGLDWLRRALGIETSRREPEHHIGCALHIGPDDLSPSI